MTESEDLLLEQELTRSVWNLADQNFRGCASEVQGKKKKSKNKDNKKSLFSSVFSTAVSQRLYFDKLQETSGIKLYFWSHMDVFRGRNLHC